MKEPLYKKYGARKPDGVCPLSNWGGLVVWFPDDEDDCELIAAWAFGDSYSNVARHKIYSSGSGRDYIRKGSGRYYLDEFMRLH